MTTLTGCIYDRVPPQAMLVNSRNAPVTLTLTGVDVEPKEFPASEGRAVWGADGKPIKGDGVCEGDGFVVTDTATGAVLGTSDEPVCGDTLIRVKEDGTVTY
ncbi:hypothetical protein [Cellulomonas sp. KRMCY2]|uniref:hypothetical protein n=1 Tax=Cellulomonas sp. KRMCY2 TaxID=1304865 RepID=UPI0012DED155|nr:hypothetical protein [Cellulomonas sp. KRMCY2]